MLLFVRLGPDLGLENGCAADRRVTHDGTHPCFWAGFFPDPKSQRNRKKRSRLALVTTVTEDSAIAALANMGSSSQPVRG